MVSDVVPWQLVPGLSILQSKWNLGYPLAMSKNARLLIVIFLHPTVLASFCATMKASNGGRLPHTVEHRACYRIA